MTAEPRPAPGLGEHTAELLRELLELSHLEIAALDASGATSVLPPA